VLGSLWPVRALHIVERCTVCPAPSWYDCYDYHTLVSDVYSSAADTMIARPVETDSKEPRPALYYPYIHVRSEHWLKATLLYAPAVKRIVPETYEPEDSFQIAKYTQIIGPHGALLQTVPANSKAADQAQFRILGKIESHIDEIKKRYGRDSSPAYDQYWIHDAKFSRELLSFLVQNNLAWQSADPHNAYGHRTWYALHPILGSAVMTTLGLSIAEEQQYDIVTPSSDFHDTLLATKQEGIFDALLNPSREVPHKSVQKRSDLAQLVITLAGVNYQALRAEDIPALQASKHLAGFQGIIRRTAQSIDPSLDAEDYKETLEDAAREIIQAWSDTKQNATSAIRKTLSTSAYAASGSALNTYLTHANVKHAAIGAGVGIGIRFVETTVDLLKNWRKPRPYQYLTELVEAQDEVLRLTFPMGLEV
jgi:hypothetical protein